MWPVAPNTSQVLGVGGLVEEGGSVVAGSWRRVFCVVERDCGDVVVVAEDIMVEVGRLLLVDVIAFRGKCCT